MTMNISDVTLDDGRKCAQLLQLLKRGRWDLSASDVQAFNETLQWVQSLAANIAPKLRSPAAKSPDPVAAPVAPTSTEGFRVKAMGPLAPSTPMRKTRKKK
jgi:hypothetical protein